MNIVIFICGLFIVSLILGFVKYGSLASAYKNAPWQLKFIEIWNDFANFFITGLIGYYFVVVRWPLLLKGINPTISPSNAMQVPIKKNPAIQFGMVI